MNRWRWPLIIGAGLALAGAVAFAVWRFAPQRQTFYTDADTIREQADLALLRDILWQPPRPLSELVNTTSEDYEPRYSWDGMTLYFVRGKAGENADIFFAQRLPGGWTEPRPLSAVNTERDELGPEPSADGQSLYFYTDRPGGVGGYDIWVARRGVDDEWQPPIHLGPAVNSEFNDYGPALSPDGATLYFASNRPLPADARGPDPDAWPATVREDLFHRTYDLYSAPITERGFGVAQPMLALNTPFNEGAPCVSPAGDFLYFSSDRPGGMGGFDLLRTRRLDGEFQTPDFLGTPVNSGANELDPGLTALGFGLVFSSDRPTQRDTAAPAEYTLYFTTSREVFRDVQLLGREPIDWAALWAAFGPNLLYALLALTLLLLLLALVGDWRKGNLSLLARCLLASLMLHLLLLMLFNFWRVTAGVMHALRNKGEIRIALSTPSRTDALTEQIHAELTSFEMPSLEAPELTPPTPIETPPREITTAELEVAQVDAAAPQPIKMDVRTPEAPEPHRQRPRAQPVVQDVTPAPPLDLQLPTPNAPQREVAEPRLAVAPSRAAPLTQRPVAFATSQPSELPREVALAPLDGRTDDDQQWRESLAKTNESREAQPQTKRLVASSPPTAAADAPQLPPLEVALPAASAAAAPQTSEREVTVAAAEAAPRAPETSTAASAAAHQSSELAELAPESSGSTAHAALDDIRLASTAQPAVRDVSPPPAPRRAATPAPATDIPPLPRLDISIPQSAMRNTNDTATEHDPTVAPVAATLVDARPALPTALTAQNEQNQTNTPKLVAIRPDRLDTKQPDPARSASTATIPLLAPRAADSTPNSYASHPIPTSPATGPAPAIALDLRLPSPDDPGADPDAVGTIRGRVFDAATGEPLADAHVRLDLPDQPPVLALTDDAGRYELPVPEMPDYFAITAAGDGFIPQSVNVPADSVERGRLRRNFELQPVTEQVVAMETDPLVHHLGNDRWEGRINSQFQRSAEGRALRMRFPLAAAQLPPHYDAAQVTFLAKGVQCPHQVRMNGVLLENRVETSPGDGSFGEMIIDVPVELLVEGANLLEIRAVTCMGDLDDFEFVNIQLRLNREQIR